MKCETPGCHNEARPKRKLCYTCTIRKHRAKHKMKYAYNTSKHNAKRRGKPFDLTFEEFEKFAVETEYISKKGITRTGFHIDRIREWEGYTKDNIQILPNPENVKKYLKYRFDEEERKMIFKTETSIKTDSNNTPF